MCACLGGNSFDGGPTEMNATDLKSETPRNRDEWRGGKITSLADALAETDAKPKT